MRSAIEASRGRADRWPVRGIVGPARRTPRARLAGPRSADAVIRPYVSHRRPPPIGPAGRKTSIQTRPRCSILIGAQTRTSRGDVNDETQVGRPGPGLRHLVWYGHAGGPGRWPAAG